MKVTITFEIDCTVKDTFGDAKTMEASVHEALCKAVHEEDVGAWEWLTTHVTDIE